jgi:hypothetical protein
MRWRAFSTVLLLGLHGAVVGTDYRDDPASLRGLSTVFIFQGFWMWPWSPACSWSVRGGHALSSSQIGFYPYLALADPAGTTFVGVSMALLRRSNVPSHMRASVDPSGCWWA